MKKNLLLYIIVLILIPIFVVSIIYKSLMISEPKKESIIRTTKNVINSNIKIKVNKNNYIEELDLEEYIIGVVAGEMPASFEIEALKAQAVASRTYAMYKIKNNSNSYDVETTVDDQVYITQDEMKEKWGNDYEYYFNKIKTAVTSTKNLVMKKNNAIFKSYYFAMSNGITADSISVFGESTSISVKSPWDNESLNKFLVTSEFTTEEIEKKLNMPNDITSIEIISRDKTNRVEKIKVNNKLFTGIEFRKLLSLRSTDFTIDMKDSTYRITTKGYGHGVGMSQYGANGMAKENYTYKEILEYYYQDIEINEL